MRSLDIGRGLLAAWVSVGAATTVSGQSIKTTDNIETDAQVVSNVETGTPPLAMSSSTVVSNLNADQVDGVEASGLALDADLSPTCTGTLRSTIPIDLWS